jgi:hypothetical protein
MTSPIWITAAGNIGVAIDQTYVEKTIIALNATSFTLSSGELPPGLSLSSQGIISGLVQLDTIPANTKYVVFNFTVNAIGVNNTVVSRSFSLSIAFSLFIPKKNLIDRVYFSNENLEYTIYKGQLLNDQQNSWKLHQGDIPSFINLSNAGTFTSQFYTVALPLKMETLLLPTENFSNYSTSWDNWLTQFLSSVKEYDYQFSIELSDGINEILQCYTIRLVYTKIPANESWISDNTSVINYDPDQYYFFFSISEFDTINWQTSENLGSVDNGSTSELSVTAVSASNLKYYLKPEYPSVMPQGIQLLDNGFISGRFSFKCYVDDPATVPLNDVYNFIIRAESESGFNFSEKLFSLKINRVYTQPYDNIWISSFPKFAERSTLLSIVNNEELFPSNIIYRLGDPWFGKITSELRFLFIAGLVPTETENYNSTVENITRRKILSISDVKTAICYDENLNIKYEVVYLEPKENTSVSLYTPITLEQMRNQVVNTIGTVATPYIPEWMRSVQPSALAPSKYTAPLGFVNAIVLAYTIPGGSELIKYRLNISKINFNGIQFEFDRYELDTIQRSTFDTTNDTYNTGPDTTFDNNTTIFEGGNTKFIDNQDFVISQNSGSQYGDKYIKFPLDGYVN